MSIEPCIKAATVATDRMPVQWDSMTCLKAQKVTNEVDQQYT